MVEKRDFVSIEDFSNDEIEQIFSMADEMLEIIQKEGRTDICYGKIMATLFFEPSTRTRFSFEAAIQRLGGGVISAPDMSVTSTRKGETLSDTVKTVSQYANIIVIRHPNDGAARVAAESASVPVINAGDGKHEHPTQTLLDLYTLKKEKGGIKNLTIALCGDLEHGRTVHSLVYGLARFGANLILIPAKEQQIPSYVSHRLANVYGMKLRKNIVPPDLKLIKDRIDVFYMTPSRDQQDLKLLRKFDLYAKEFFFEDNLRIWTRYDSVYITRLQKERFTKLNGVETVMSKEDYPVINGDLLKDSKYKATVIMHPLPRVDELSPEVDTDHRAIYFKQAAYGVPVRMALMAFLLEQKKLRLKSVKKDNGKWVGDKEVTYLSCENQNCVSHPENRIVPPRFKFSPSREKINGFHVLIYPCAYCDMVIRATHAGNSNNKKYMEIHPSLNERIRDWRNHRHLVVFKSEEEAKKAGFKPYKPTKGREILRQQEIEVGLAGITDQIEKTEALDNLVFLGVEKEGKVIAQRLAALLKERTSIEIPIAGLNTNAYRDDITVIHEDESNQAEIPFSIENKTIMLFDDVVCTGRTARAALDIIFDKKVGRPKDVKLAVLINVKNFRELPINPNISVKEIELPPGKLIKVKLKEIDKVDQAVEYSAKCRLV